jgi:uncharacterized protein (TIGR03435 family)
MRTWLVAFLSLAAADFAHGQTPGTPAWDVVSVKLNQDCGGRGRGMSAPPSPGRLNLECNTVENLIRMAYVFFKNGSSLSIKETPINGGPGWIHSENYAINAKAEGPVPVPQMMGPMLRNLLEDRFKLKIRRETREGPVYVMTVAKTGSKLQAPRKEAAFRWISTTCPSHRPANRCPTSAATSRSGGWARPHR